jgi:hypothetical protein
MAHQDAVANPRQLRSKCETPARLLVMFCIQLATLSHHAGSGGCCLTSLGAGVQMVV